MTKFITETGSKFLLQGDTLTPLADDPMHEGNGKPLDTQVNPGEMEGGFQQPTVCVPFVARVRVKPLATSPVAMVIPGGE